MEPEKVSTLNCPLTVSVALPMQTKGKLSKLSATYSNHDVKLHLFEWRVKRSLHEQSFFGKVDFDKENLSV